MKNVIIIFTRKQFKKYLIRHYLTLFQYMIFILRLRNIVLFHYIVPSIDVVTCERKGNDCIQVHKVTSGAVVSASAQNIGGLGSDPNRLPIFPSGSLSRHVTLSADTNSPNLIITTA